MGSRGKVNLMPWELRVVDGQVVVWESGPLSEGESIKLMPAPVARDLADALGSARACMEWCVNLGADEYTARSLNRGIAVVDAALKRYRSES